MFGEKLKELRIARNLKLKDLANEFKVSEKTISSWENNKHETDFETLKKIAIFFDFSTDYLLGLEDISGRKIK